MSENLYSRSEFECSTVIFQIRPDEVDENKDLDWENLVKLSETLKLRGQVKTSKYNNKQKRWINDEIECYLCGEWYGINNQTHTAELCKAAHGYPITDRNRSYPFAHLKRFKSLTYMVP